MSEIGLADVLAGVGLALVAAGCWGLWGWAAAALVVGVVVLLAGVVGAVRGMGGEGRVGGDDGRGTKDGEGRDG